MTRGEAADVWRLRVIEMIESGMSASQWARDRGIPPTTFLSHVRRVCDEEPALFALSARFCPCPLIARIIRYRDPDVREYLKQVWFELAALSRTEAARSGKLGEGHACTFKAVAGSFAPDATAADVNVGFLTSLGVSASWASPGEMTKPAVLAAVASGVNDGDPFFEWASSNEAAIREHSQSGAVLRRVIEGRAYDRARIFRYRKSSGMAVMLVAYDASSPFCIGLLDGFLAEREASMWGDATFFTRFEESLGFAPRSLEDFTPETFGRQLRWFDECCRGNARSCTLKMTRLFYMHVIGLLPDDQQAFTFATGLPPKALGYNNIVKMWLEGYRAVAYEPLDPAPDFPKWLLYPNASEALKATFRIDTPRIVDCSVGDPALERLLVDWLWSGGLGPTSVRRAPCWVGELLRKVAARGVSIVRDGVTVPVIEARSVSSALSSFAERNRRDGKIQAIKSMLRSFLRFAEGAGAVVEPACYLLLGKENLGSPGGLAGGGRTAVPDEHLALLAGELERMSERSVSDELTYIAFITQALTNIRFGEVLSLRIADLDASHRSDVKAVRVCRKCGGYDYEVVQVPDEVHRLLQTAARITEPVRERADESIAGHVFLVDGAMGMVKVLSNGTCNTRFAAACTRLGIPRIRPADVRRAFQTNVIMEGAKRNWSRMMLRPITGHADIRSDEHYIAPDIMDPETRRYLEGAHVVEIGNPRIRGKVLPDDEVRADVAALVEGGAGVCRSGECDVLGTVPCFECRSFATAPRLIPEMAELVAAIDGQLASAPLHQREHLMTAKRHALAYLGAMIDMKKRKEAADGGAGGA